MSQHDDIYSKPRPYITDFEFDQKVASVFDDMITRSVPGYRSLISQLGVFAQHYYQPGTRIYDLGSSLGAGTLVCATALAAQQPQIIAVDNAVAMIEKSTQRVRELGITGVEHLCADVRDVDITNASVVLLNFTLQFIEPQSRLALLQKICSGLLPGGVLLVSEKIVAEDPASELEALHLDFKRGNGYSELEISQKRSALEQVLVPDTRQQHQARLLQAGFRHCEQWFQSFNFVSFFAVK